MIFGKFISLVFEILGSYYFIILLFDILKSSNKIAQVTTHVIQFDTIEKPVIVSAPEKILQSINMKSEENFKKYLPPEGNVQTRVDKKSSPLIDLGLETLSGDAYTVNAENLSKFMIA